MPLRWRQPPLMAVHQQMATTITKVAVVAAAIMYIQILHRRMPTPPPLPTILQHPPRITHLVQRSMRICTGAVPHRQVVRIPDRRVATVLHIVLPRRPHQLPRHTLMPQVRWVVEMSRQVRLQLRRDEEGHEAFNLPWRCREHRRL